MKGQIRDVARIEGGILVNPLRTLGGKSGIRWIYCGDMVRNVETDIAVERDGQSHMTVEGSGQQSVVRIAECLIVFNEGRVIHSLAVTLRRPPHRIDPRCRRCVTDTN